MMHFIIFPPVCNNILYQCTIDAVATRTRVLKIDHHGDGLFDLLAGALRGYTLPTFLIVFIDYTFVLVLSYCPPKFKYFYLTLEHLTSPQKHTSEQQDISGTARKSSSETLVWPPSHAHTRICRHTCICIDQLYGDSGYILEYHPIAMQDRNGWCERVIYILVH